LLVWQVWRRVTLEVWLVRPRVVRSLDFIRLIIAFGSATSRAAASASAGHVNLPSNGNWLGISLGLTAGLVGGLCFFMT